MKKPTAITSKENEIYKVINDVESTNLFDNIIMKNSAKKDKKIAKRYYNYFQKL